MLISISNFETSALAADGTGDKNGQNCVMKVRAFETKLPLTSYYANMPVYDHSVIRSTYVFLIKCQTYRATLLKAIEVGEPAMAARKKIAGHALRYLAMFTQLAEIEREES